MRRILTFSLIIFGALTLSACAGDAPVTPVTSPPNTSTARIGDCYEDDGAFVPVSCDADHDLVVFALPRTDATSEAELDQDMDDLCAPLADLDRTDEVTVIGPTLEQLTAGDRTLECLYETDDR